MSSKKYEFRSIFIFLLNCGRFAFAITEYKSPNISTSIYPTAHRDETIIDDYHGIKVADPYRWLEEPDTQQTRQFVDDLNAVSEPFLAEAPDREQIKIKRVDSLTEYLTYDKYSPEGKKGDFYYYWLAKGSQNYAVLYQQETLEDHGEMFLDPNNMSTDGTVSLSLVKWSMDGSLLAYAVSEKGSDQFTIKFRDVHKRDLADVIENVKHTSPAWLKDNSGVFYSDYKNKSFLHSLSQEGKNRAIYFHRMGTNSAEDILVYDANHTSCEGEVTDDGLYLIIATGTDFSPNNTLYYYDLTNFDISHYAITPKPLFEKMDGKYDYIDHDNDSMLIRTNYNAPKFKLVRISIKNGSVWDVVPEHENSTLKSICVIAGSRLVLKYLDDIKHKLHVHDLNSGAYLYSLPFEGNIDLVCNERSQDELFVTVETMTVPLVAYRVDFSSNSSIPELKELHRDIVKGIDEDEFLVKKVFFDSKDGTKIPMSILQSRISAQDGGAPVLLYGYGGFDETFMPSFQPDALLFVKHFNGIYAIAHIRGGGEYGERWHEAGMRENKQNVFDDFIAAAEYLIGSNYTTSRKLAIEGASNGGLLVAVCAQQRPDLYGAVVGDVGVLDMLRFHKYAYGSAWISEYGDPDEAEDFKFIYKYSPLHNIRYPKHGQWPSTLMRTADHDDRVDPSHTLKYAATLYDMVKAHPEQTNPILFCVERDAGHGERSLTKSIADSVDIYSFLQRVLDLKWKF